MEIWEKVAREEIDGRSGEQASPARTCYIDSGYVLLCLDNQRKGMLKIEHSGEYWKVKCVKGSFEYWLWRDKFHRIGGPAFNQYYRNVTLWRVHGKEIESWHQYRLQTRCSEEDLITLKLKWGSINTEHRLSRW
jgi:hypothetical protein